MVSTEVGSGFMSSMIFLLSTCEFLFFFKCFFWGASTLIWTIYSWMKSFKHHAMANWQCFIIAGNTVDVLVEHFKIAGYKESINANLIWQWWTTGSGSRDFNFHEKLHFKCSLFWWSTLIEERAWVGRMNSQTKQTIPYVPINRVRHYALSGAIFSV